jgi:hypothetical protein
MSDARAIEAVTQTLVSLVDIGIKEVEASAVAVARPIDRVTDTSFAMQVNVLLYQAAVDPQLRNQPPLTVLPGETGDPALPLSLHYLITPYVEDGNDIAAHRMLGGALRVLHEHPALTRAELAQIAPYSDVADDIEQITINWQGLEEKDIYSLWSAFQSPYRLSAAFEVRVVTIDSRRSAKAPLPVLRRGSADRGPEAQGTVLPPFATLTGASGPNGQAAAFLGDTVTLTGTNLGAGSASIRMSHPVLADPVLISDPVVTPTTMRFTVPDAPATVPAGLWSIAALTTSADGSPIASNEIPLAVAPRITSQMPLTVARAGRTARIRLDCAPSVWPGQALSLLLADDAVAPAPVTTVTGTVDFVVPDAEPGAYLVRLRVGGVDSPLVNRSTTPPSFDPTQTVTVT